MDEVPIRFCPFCRDPYEDVRRCPEHDLPLVPFEALPRRPETISPDTLLSPFSLRAGRGALGVAALLMLFVPALPWFQVRVDDRVWTASGYALAMGRAINTWIVPAVGLGWLLVLRRFRTPRRLRAVRPAVVLLASLPPVSIALTWYRLELGLRGARRAGLSTAVEPRVGLLLLGAALGLGFWAAWRLGRLPREV